MDKLKAAKILLTSAGFETSAIRNAFLELIGKQPEDIRVLFIPTAAIFAEAIKVLPKCMDDLLKSNIPAENIQVFDLHRALSFEELSTFDAVYFTGGSPTYLMERINKTGFNIPLNKFVNNGGVYVGVSAGSYVAAGNFPNSLGYLKATLSVHVDIGTAIGIFENETVAHIDLTDKNAVMIHNGVYKII
ncbi:MAG: Type 1 glutamine amidotransferase-like domain-containing protein [Defluviitaleaceae bacterium]|nr:Type 1 glutamine amidotransferase-like domain-containing protein [Defluviitaleaceae bacterium]